VGSAVRYVCVMAYAEPGGEEQTFAGICDGTLAADARGSGGFGYDPVFLPDDVGDGRTMAELSDAEKDAISHRGRAARELLAWMRSRESPR
jgi:XTP/dITP diphosphohydrolase